MLKIENLSKQFDTSLAVDKVSLEVKPGEIFALIGPNGSGKTTIIKTIAGLLKPTAGRITVGGIDMATDPVRAKALIGYIPDEPVIWPAVTGGEFLDFSGALYNLSETDRHSKIEELLKIFDLGPIAGGYFEDYSRGNKQKFAILAALLHQPKLLLIDEPIVGLDPVSAEAAQEQFKKFASQGGAVLLVTHTLGVAQSIADRIGVLKRGKLATVGSYRELCGQSGLEPGADLEAVYKVLTK